MSVSKRLIPPLIVSLFTGVVLGAVIAALCPGAAFFSGWLAAGLISWVAVFCLLSAWQWAGGGKLLFWMVTLTFALRLVVGIGAGLLLPEYGFDDPTQNAGYLFKDAYARDVEAFDITRSGASFLQIFSMDFDNDQYGGLLVLAGLVYQYLSPDAHRAFLIILLSSFAAALGIPFLWKAVQQRWGTGSANFSAWILALYPDYILFSASQMREPYLITFACMAIWGLVLWRTSWKKSLAVMAASLLGMGIFSSRVVVIVTALLAVWFWLEYLVSRSKFFRWLGYAGLALAGLGIVIFSWDWLRSSAWYDLRLTVLNSGRMQYELNAIKEWLRTPFLMGYGLLQPVLPAIIAYPTLTIWKWIGILRSLGWYLLAPFLLYGFLVSWKAQPKSERRILVWFTLITAVWMLISSARGGGDQWDNPRYRLILLPWMAILAARGLEWARLRRDAWLFRLGLVELIFVGFFSHWYISRYLKWWERLPFKEMIAWILLLSAAVVIGGWFWDLYRKRLKQKHGAE